MQRVSLRAIIILVTVVSIYLYFFPPAKKNSFHAELQKKFDPVFGVWQLTTDSSMLILVLNKDTTYSLMQVNAATKDTIGDVGKYVVAEFGINNGTGYGFLTLASNNTEAVTYEMQVYKLKELELIDKKTRLITRFKKQ
jgi:hypothetical protein